MDIAVWIWGGFLEASREKWAINRPQAHAMGLAGQGMTACGTQEDFRPAVCSAVVLQAERPGVSSPSL